MTLFEFVTVMVSMILALSLGHLLEGISYLIRVRDRVRWSLPYLLWLAMLVFALINHWWALWDFREYAWNYASFLYILIAPITLSFGASMIAPDRPDVGAIDLRTHYARSRQAFALAMVIYALAMWFDGPLFAGQKIFGLIGLMHIPMIGAYSIALVSKSRAANIAAGCVALGGLFAIMLIRLLALIA